MEGSKTLRMYSLYDYTVENAVLKSLLGQKQNDGIFCDVTMRVCGREVKAHSCVLASISPYFASFFRSDLPRCYSQRSPQVIEIMVDGSESEMSLDLGDAVCAVVDYIYSGTLQIDMSNVGHIAEIARVMQIDSVIKFCEDFTANRLAANGTSHVYRRKVDVTDAAVCTDNDWYGNSQIILLTAPPNAVSGRFSANGQKAPHAVQLVSVSTQVFPSLLGIMPDDVNEDLKLNYSNAVSEIKTAQKTNGITSKDTIVHQVVGGAGSDEAKDETKAESVPRDVVDERRSKEHDNPDEAACGEKKPSISKLKLPSVSVRHSQRMRRKSVKLADSSVSQNLIACKGRLATPRQQVGCFTRRLVKNIDSQDKCGTSKSDNAEKVDKFSTEAETISCVTSQSENDAEDSPRAADTVSQQTVKKFVSSNGFFRVYKFNCAACGFATNNVRKMSAHTRDHKLANNICFYCERCFDSSETLSEHISSEHQVTGAVPRPFSCSECGVWFRSHGQLAAHLPKHSAKRPFICDTCGATFKWRNALRNHAITHSSSKEHLCDVCGYATAHRAQLRAHRLVHTGDTLRCPWEGCEYRAIRLQNLKFHYLTHTQEKAHQCEYCGQSFSLQKNMKRHMLLHMDTAKRHKCTRCDFTTLRYDKLKDHLHKQHNVGSAPERRLRITDLVNRSLSDELSANLNDEMAEEDAVDVAPELEQTTSSAPVVYTDAMQILQLPEGLALINGGLSLVSSGEGHAITLLQQDQAIVLRPSVEFVSGTDYPSLQYVTLGGDQQVSAVAGGLGQDVMNEILANY